MAQGIKGSQGICGTVGCERPIRRRGLCNRCSQRYRKANPDDRLVRRTAMERFWGRFERQPNGCWYWTGAIFVATGYGQFYLDGVLTTAHRASYQILVGPIQGEAEIDHLCHTRDRGCPGGDTCPHRRCVNPSHLEPVSHHENAIRGRSVMAVNAAKTHCANGHEFTPANTYWYTAPGRTRPGRRCRACARRPFRKSKAAVPRDD